MYGIEYEDDILLLLRMIKFLHMQSPDAAHIFCQSHPVVDMEELLMVIDEVMWDIFDDVNFFFDEEYEATVVQCSHPVIDRLYELGRASDPKHGSRQSVWSKKLHDIPLPAPLCLFYATTVQSFSGICFNRHAQAFSQAFAFSDSGHFTNIPSSI